jgi:hypothetical protein
MQKILRFDDLLMMWLQSLSLLFQGFQNKEANTPKRIKKSSMKFLTDFKVTLKVSTQNKKRT